jgi:hypothetical protein
MNFRTIFFPPIVLACLALASGCQTTEAPKASDSSSSSKWTTLFDGKPTDKLRGYKMTGFPSDNWVIDGDALKTVPGKAVDLMTVEKYKDFELEVEWKVKPVGNSGIIYRVAETDGPTYTTGPEMQVLDDQRHPDGKNPKTTAGALYALIAPSANKKVNPAGEWNKAKLIIKNNHVEHWLNGIKIVEYEWASPEVKALIKVSKFKDMPLFMTQPEGYVALQHHGEEAWFRNVRIRRL